MAKKAIADDADAKEPAKKQKAQTEERQPTLEDRFAEFSSRYKWFVFVPLLIAIGIVVVLSIHSGQRKRLARNALEAFDMARTAPAFDAVAAQYPNTFAGRSALVQAADMLYDQGKHAEARKRYQAYLDTDPDPLLGMPVWMAIVQTYIAEKDYAKGISTCNAVLAEPGSEYVRMQAHYYKGYCHEMSGNAEEAMVEYGKVASRDQQGGPWYGPAQARLTELQRKTAAALREAAGVAGKTSDEMPELPDTTLETLDD
jgi:tetratricopeptide (TPR) repeat protein